MPGPCKRSVAGPTLGLGLGLAIREVKFLSQTIRHHATCYARQSRCRIAPIGRCRPKPRVNAKARNERPVRIDLGRFMECERGLSHVGQRGPLAGEIAGAPATSDPGYRECCIVLSVLRARVAGAEVRIAG